MPTARQQHTIKKPVSFSGIGLHSGNKVQLTILPATVNSGIRFRRVDLDGRPEIEALVENVSETNRSTTLSRGNIKVHTVEHVMAALIGCQVDNVVIELDANEPPIADGSSRVFSQLIEQVGLEIQDETVEPYMVTAPVEIQAGDTRMTVFPYDGFKITCTSSDQQGRFTQFFSVELTPESWVRDLAPARTFCFFEEIEYLFNKGLIRGGSLENAIIIRDDAVLTNEPLRFPEEFVRHKILDIIGDLALLGRPVLGHVTAVKPCHMANAELAKAILSQVRKPQRVAETFAPPPPPIESRPSATQPLPEVKTTQNEPPIQDGMVLDTAQIMKVLPHRYPFLMVDRITFIQGNRITGVKNVSLNEPYFQGHFPGHPIMPGVLQLEAIAQVAGILMLRLAENAGKVAYFMSADSVKWRRPVRPGDVLNIEVELTKSRGKIGKAKGTCLVEGEVVSEALVTFTLVDA